MTSADAIPKPGSADDMPLQFQRGRKSFRSGEPMPKAPVEGEDDLFWLGYMLERAEMLEAQREAKRILGVEDDDLDPA